MTTRRDAVPTHVESPLPAVFDQSSRVLLLGSMPSPKSRENGFHYGNPQNRFWRVIAALWGEDAPQTTGQRLSLLSRHHIALHDVLASCDIVGASDATIENPVPNDLRPILRVAPIRGIFCTGSASARHYHRYIEPDLGIPCTRLPSTSPANASWSFERLVEAYQAVRRVADKTDEG